MGGHTLDPAVAAIINEKIDAQIRAALPSDLAELFAAMIAPPDPLSAVRSIVAGHSEELARLGVTP